MSDADIERVIYWFKQLIQLLEYAQHYQEIREQVNRLRGFVEVLEKELYGVPQF